VARRRVVLFGIDPANTGGFWMTREYLPEVMSLVSGSGGPTRWEKELGELLPGRLQVETVPVPHDCRDGFYGAWWRRPAAFLDPVVRAGISVFSQVPEAAVTRALDRLRADLDSGAWARRHADLLELDELDLGYRVITVELD
jgi:hypothetical protein